MGAGGPAANVPLWSPRACFARHPVWNTAVKACCESAWAGACDQDAASAFSCTLRKGVYGLLQREVHRCLVRNFDRNGVCTQGVHFLNQSLVGWWAKGGADALGHGGACGSFAASKPGRDVLRLAAGEPLAPFSGLQREDYF